MSQQTSYLFMIIKVRNSFVFSAAPPDMTNDLVETDEDKS